MKNRYRVFCLTILIVSAIFTLVCTRTPIGDYVLSQGSSVGSTSGNGTRVLPAQYGNGADGDLTITAPGVIITDIFENDLVTGVTSQRGVNRGLNKGTGTYDPKNGAYIQARNFTIANGGSITANQRSASDKQGVIWITCTENFTNQGTIDLAGKGHSGGGGGPNGSSIGSSGAGPGGGGGGAPSSVGNATNSISGGGGGAGHVSSGSSGGTPPSTGAAGGSSGLSYGSTTIPTTIWPEIYGSGGGGGGGVTTALYGSSAGGAGGSGGGHLRIVAASILNAGAVNASGNAGANTSQTGYLFPGAGGGGSGGTVYFEGIDNITIGTNLVNASAGSAGSCCGLGNGGGGSSSGRVRIVGTYSGTTIPAAQ